MGPEVPVVILILAIPIYFLSKWILRKLRLGNQKNRKFLAIIPTVILSPVTYIAIIMILFFPISHSPDKDFNKQEWETNIKERYMMSADIVESDLLIGKTKQEIIELLGPEYTAFGKNHICYNLGFVPGAFNIDPDVLDIHFEKGIVIKVSQNES